MHYTEFTKAYFTTYISYVVTIYTPIDTAVHRIERYPWFWVSVWTHSNRQK